MLELPASIIERVAECKLDERQSDAGGKFFSYFKLRLVCRALRDASFRARFSAIRHNLRGAIVLGDDEWLRRMLEAGANPDGGDAARLAPLHIAAAGLWPSSASMGRTPTWSGMAGRRSKWRGSAAASGRVESCTCWAAERTCEMNTNLLLNPHAPKSTIA